jgi:hypothetical protein
MPVHLTETEKRAEAAKIKDSIANRLPGIDNARELQNFWPTPRAERPSLALVRKLWNDPVGTLLDPANEALFVALPRIMFPNDARAAGNFYGPFLRAKLSLRQSPAVSLAGAKAEAAARKKSGAVAGTGGKKASGPPSVRPRFGKEPIKSFAEMAAALLREKGDASPARPDKPRDALDEIEFARNNLSRLLAAYKRRGIATPSGVTACVRAHAELNRRYGRLVTDINAHKFFFGEIPIVDTKATKHDRTGQFHFTSIAIAIAAAVGLGPIAAYGDYLINNKARISKSFGGKQIVWPAPKPA